MAGAGMTTAVSAAAASRAAKPVKGTAASTTRPPCRILRRAGYVVVVDWVANRPGIDVPPAAAVIRTRHPTQLDNRAAAAAPITKRPSAKHIALTSLCPPSGIRDSSGQCVQGVRREYAKLSE